MDAASMCIIIDNKCKYVVLLLRNLFEPLRRNYGSHRGKNPRIMQDFRRKWEHIPIGRSKNIFSVRERKIPPCGGKIKFEVQYRAALKLQCGFSKDSFNYVGIYWI